MKAGESGPRARKEKRMVQAPQEIIAGLSAPFPEGESKDTWDYTQKRNFTYIPWQNVVSRLNEVVPGWEWEFVGSKEVQMQGRNGPFLAQQFIGKLTIPGIGSRVGVGSAKIGDGEDDIKIASTDALKRAAALFGIGLYLRGQEDENRQQQGQYQQHAPQGHYQQQVQNPQYPPHQQQRPPQQQSFGGGNWDQQQYPPGPNGMTGPQRGMIMRHMNRTGQENWFEVTQVAGVRSESIEDLDKDGASAVISYLKELPSGGGQYQQRPPQQHVPQGNYQQQQGGYQDTDLNQVPF